MGSLVRFDRMTSDELRYLFVMPTTTEDAARVRRLAYGEWFRRRPTRRLHGRWDLLVWFTRTERILSRDELAELLNGDRDGDHPIIARHRLDGANLRPSVADDMRQTG